MNSFRLQALIAYSTWVLIFAVLLRSESSTAIAAERAGPNIFCEEVRGLQPGTPEFSKCIDAVWMVQAKGGHYIGPENPAATPRDDALEHLEQIHPQIGTLCNSYGLQKRTPAYKDCIECEAGHVIANTDANCASEPVCQQLRAKVCGRKLGPDQARPPAIYLDR